MITTITPMAATIYSQAIPNMSSSETTFLLLFNSKYSNKEAGKIQEK